MGDLTKDIPKPLLQNGDATLIEHKLKNLPPEVGEVVIVVGFLGDMIKAALGNEQDGLPISYVEQKELKGTGHAVSLCEPVLRERFLVLMGDDLYAKSDLEELSRHPLAVLAWESPGTEEGRKTGELISGPRGELLRIVEARPTKKGMLLNTGAYSLDRRFFNYPLQPAGLNGELGLPQTLAHMAESGEEVRIVKARWWKNITEPGDLES